MKPPRFDYRDPATLEEALALKAESREESAILAGGQSLIPMLNLRLARPEILIDLGRIPDLAFIERRNRQLAIGCMTRQRDLESSAVIRDDCPLIAETLGHVGHVAIRNRGTVGGSIAHADPAAELPAALLALDGEVEVAREGARRTIKAQDLFVFHFTTALEPDEVLVEVRVPILGSGTGWAFVELARRHGDYALAAVCALLRLSRTGRVEDARLAVAGVSGSVRRAWDGERGLLGGPADDATLRAAAEATEGVVAAEEGTGAEHAYRRQLVGALAHRALSLARERSEAARSSEEPSA